jgi:RimJ/RimL family protein N-acetyltransferase
MTRLRAHDITLRADPVVLRPLSDDDWALVHKWWADPQVAYYAHNEDNEQSKYTLERVREIVSTLSQKAFCFVIEYEGRPVGECWLQEMNLPRVLERRPGRDIRRIDIEIGETEFWGRGIGTEAIRLLVDLGFRCETVDAIYACDVADYNPRSRRAFQKNGFQVVDRTERRPGAMSRYNYDLAVTREEYEATR